jgi:hypothetical protein
MSLTVRVSEVSQRSSIEHTPSRSVGRERETWKRSLHDPEWFEGSCRHAGRLQIFFGRKVECVVGKTVRSAWPATRLLSR